MSDENTYQPPKVWEWKKNGGGAFANINRPISGATHEKDLPWAPIRCNFIRWEHLTARK